MAAIDQNFAIGHKGKLLSKQSEDLKHFKKLTQNQFVVMGRKTYESIGHPLPDRHNIVISNKAHKLDYHPEVSLFSSVSEVMSHYEDYAERKIDLYIIGGGSIYEQFLPFCDQMYLTIIQNRFKKCDTYYPKFNLDDWNDRLIKVTKPDQNNKYECYFKHYTRKQAN